MSLLFLDWEIDANDVFGSLWPHTSDFQNPAATTCPAVSQATTRSTRAFVVSSCNAQLTAQENAEFSQQSPKTLPCKRNKGECSYVPKMYGLEPVASLHFFTAFL